MRRAHLARSPMKLLVLTGRSMRMSYKKVGKYRALPQGGGISDHHTGVACHTSLLFLLIQPLSLYPCRSNRIEIHALLGPVRVDSILYCSRLGLGNKIKVLVSYCPLCCATISAKLGFSETMSFPRIPGCKVFRSKFVQIV